VAAVSQRKEKAGAHEPHCPLGIATYGNGGRGMRDIRNDLLERADLAQDRIKAADVHFDRLAKQLRSEHEASVADLKAILAMIAKLIEFENRQLANTPSDMIPPPSLPENPQKLRRVI
jgi:hypothetical protein